MFVFLVSEVPRVFLFLLFSVKYISQPITRSGRYFIFQSVNLLMMGFEQSMKIILRDYTGILTENKDREMIFRFILEGMKIFTIIGCMSNFIIYISMSRKLRNEIKSLYKRVSECNFATDRHAQSHLYITDKLKHCPPITMSIQLDTLSYIRSHYM